MPTTHSHQSAAHRHDAPPSRSLIASPRPLRLSWLRHAAAGRLVGVGLILVPLWLAVYWALT